jgi:hypothetical protein
MTTSKIFATFYNYKNKNYELEVATKSISIITS